MDAVSFVHAYFHAYALEDVCPQPKSQDKNPLAEKFFVISSCCFFLSNKYQLPSRLTVSYGLCSRSVIGDTSLILPYFLMQTSFLPDY